MLNKSVKQIALLLIFVYLFLIKSGYTAADIFAERVVVHDKLSAVTLDFSTLASSNDTKKENLFNSVFQPGGFDVNSIRIKWSSSGTFKYHIQVVKTDGDDFLCGKLKLKVFDRNFKNKFDGQLLDFKIDSEILNGNTDDWIFMASLDDSSQELKNKVCKFDLDIKTYYDSPAEIGGIFVEKRISSSISTIN
jgi:hypothetical protein